MKKGIFTLAAVVFLLSAGSAWGQTRSFRADIPFAFSIGPQTFPAGHYQFQSLLGKPGRSSQLGMIAVRDLDGRHLYKVVITTLVSSRRAAQSQSKLVFDMHAGLSYLSRIQTAGDALTQQLPDPDTGSNLTAATNQTEVILADLH
jgi:hypothetical protein